MDGAIAAGLADSRRGSRGSCAINEALLVVYSALPQVHGEVMGISGGWDLKCLRCRGWQLERFRVCGEVHADLGLAWL